MMVKLGRFLAICLSLVSLGLIALVVWPSTPAPLPDSSDSRIVRNVRIVDVLSGKVLPPSSIEIRGGVITEIGPDLPDEGLPVVDGGGAFAIPGLWDMHVHTFQNSPQAHFPLWIANGVTAVRDMMDCPGIEDSLIACHADKRAWNAASAAGRLTAPRIVETASYYLEGGDVTPRQVRSRVAEYDSRGLNAIKVYNRLPRTSYLAAAQEAGQRGLRLVGHLPKEVDLIEAIEVGQTSFEHAHLLPRHCFARAGDWREGKLDEMTPLERDRAIVAEYDAARCASAIEAMAKKGVWYVPTLVTREEDMRADDPEFVDDARLAYLDPLSKWAWNDDLSATRSAYVGPEGRKVLTAYFEHARGLSGQAYQGGANLLVGTDTILGGFRYHDEMAHLVRAGLSPAEVLRAATYDAARYVGEESVTGSIAVGKRADLVLLAFNPLTDIGNTRSIRAVVQGGRLYDRARLDELLDYGRGQAKAPHNWAKLVWGFVRSSVNGDL